jgi:chromosome segregation ATPase
MLPPPSPSQSVSKLQTRIAGLESELEITQVQAAASPRPSQLASSEEERQPSVLMDENARLQARILYLETHVDVAEATAQGEKDALLGQLRDAQTAFETLKDDLESKTRASEAQIADFEVSLANLRVEAEAKTAESLQHEQSVKDLEKELKALQEKFASVTAGYESDKKELGLEVDELRLAGQVSFRDLSALLMDY